MLLIFSLKKPAKKTNVAYFFIKLVETKQHSQATTIEILKSETGWKFHVLLIKKTECIVYYGNPTS